MSGRSWILLATGPLMLGAATALAHHSITANFDTSRSVEIRGEVVDFKMRSPHSSLVVEGYTYIDGMRQGATAQRWEIESSATSGLRGQGLMQDSIQPGAQIVVVGSPHKNESLTRLNSSNFRRPDGTSFGEPRAPGRDSGPAVAEVPADAHGVERVQGRWRPPYQREGTRSALPLNAAGLQAWNDYDQKLSPANTCEPMNIPVVYNAPGYYVDIRFFDDRAVVQNQAYDIVRTVPLGGASALADPEGRFGVVAGSFEGDTFVIESSDFPPSRWGLGAATQINGGGADVPSSDQKEITERFSVSEDGRTLIYEYTLFDPVYMSEPHDARIEMARVADDAAWIPYDCNVDAASMFSRAPGESLLDGE